MFTKGKEDYACNIIDIVGELTEEKLKEPEEHYEILRVANKKQGG